MKKSRIKILLYSIKLRSLDNEFHSSNQSFILSFSRAAVPLSCVLFIKYKRKQYFQYNVHMPTVNTLQTKLYCRESLKKKNSISIISFLIFNRAHKEYFYFVDIFVNIRTAILIIIYIAIAIIQIIYYLNKIYKYSDSQGGGITFIDLRL